MTSATKRTVWVVPALVFALQGIALAQSPCPRYAAGSMVSEPEDLYSKDGVLAVSFTYQTYQDDTGKTYFCFVNSDGVQSPTLHVQPGDVLKLTLTNLVPEGSGKHRLHACNGNGESGRGWLRRSEHDLIVGQHSLSWHEYSADLPSG
ncbi:MAG TPA: hypothetical protein VGI60_15050 [Chthoniobacterales bacterium]